MKDSKKESKKEQKEEKKHLNRRKIIIFSLIALLVIVIVAIVALGIRINFILNDELIIRLTPLDKSIVTLYGQEKNVTFNFQNYNSLFCKSKCTYEFKDLSNNRLIDSETLTLKSRTNVTRSYNLLPSIYGPGQEIYSFEIRCNNLKTFFCTTEENEQFKSSFITLSYDLSEADRNKLLAINSRLNNFLDRAFNLEIGYQRLNYSFYLATPKLKDTLFFEPHFSFSDSVIDLNSDFLDLKNESLNLFSLWTTGKYDLLNDAVEQKNYTLNNFSNKLSIQEEKFNILKNDYNNLVNNITLLANNSLVIDSIIDYSNTTNNSLLQNQSIKFKDNTKEIQKLFFNKTTNLDFLNKRIISLMSDIGYLINQTNTTLVPNYSLENEFINGISVITKISNVTFALTIPINISLPDPKCCVFGKCKTCCTTETCSADPRLFPVIFIHGHSFNKKSSPETSLNSFTKMQRRLQEEGVINTGQLDLRNLEEIPRGEYGKFGNPISISATYYYINFYELGTYRITAQKSERIENYALRLNEIVNIVKERTGAEKVNIVAHSMGGLVSREYIRIFSDAKVNKIILIGAPNFGIKGRLKDLCSFTGSEKECEDMSQDSIFLKRLNQAKPLQKVIIYTIAGTGCNTENEDGDGIVVLKNVPLPYAKNFTTPGTCTDILKSNLHQDLIDPEKYPEVYNIVKKLLRE
ncbi:alpha/beta fold hydrolase [Candidatus Woesearchaeota archaeon]|nr:alpha/beta fold hydrolase [Candidatus Woesearchaeota archaeon]